MDLKPQLEAINEVIELIESEIGKVIHQIKCKKEELEKLSGIERDHASLLREIENIKSELEMLNRQLEDINRKKDEIKRLESERKEKYEKFIKKYIELKINYEKII